MSVRGLLLQWAGTIKIVTKWVALGLVIYIIYFTNTFIDRIPFDKSHIEQIGLEDKMLEEVDQSIEGEINHAIFDQQDDNG